MFISKKDGKGNIQGPVGKTKEGLPFFCNGTHYSPEVLREIHLIGGTLRSRRGIRFSSEIKRMTKKSEVSCEYPVRVELPSTGPLF